MEFSEQVKEQVKRIQECVAYFPKGTYPPKEMAYMLHAMIGPEIQERVGRKWTQAERLEWLCDALVREQGTWPKNGLAEIRGWYCDTFTPADGLNIWSTMENPPKPARLPVDDGVPRIGASPVDVEFDRQIVEFDKQLEAVVAKVRR